MKTTESISYEVEVDDGDDNVTHINIHRCRSNTEWSLTVDGDGWGFTESLTDEEAEALYAVLAKVLIHV
jgi:hypothetical protein